MDWILGNMHPEFISGAIGCARLDAAAREEHRERGVMMVATGFAFLFVDLGIGRAPELAAPDYEGVFEQSPLFQVGQ